MMNNVADHSGYWLSAHARIRTSNGETEVAALAVGDLVATADGSLERVRRLSSALIDCAWHPDAQRHMPICIAAHAFGLNAPAGDLIVSPDLPLRIEVCGRQHCILVGELINGATIQRILTPKATYWCVELGTQSLIFAENIVCVTYLSAKQHVTYAMDTRIEAIVELRKHMRETARSLGWQLEEEPFANLRLSVDNSIIDASFSGQTASFSVPGNARDVYLECDGTRPYYVSHSEDGRCLGLYLSRIIVISEEEREIKIDDPLLCVGFHACEPNGMRWTTSRARLPKALLGDHSNNFTLRVEQASSSLPRWLNARYQSTPASSPYVHPQHIGFCRRPYTGNTSSVSNKVIFFWCDDTIRQDFETGVQRVTRRLLQGLRGNDVSVILVGWNWDRKSVVTLGGDDIRGGDNAPGGVPLETILANCPDCRWLVMPELPLTLAAAGLDPLQIARAYGLRTAAVLHDLIPLKFSAHYNEKFLLGFRRYFEMLRFADVVIVGTEYVANDIRIELERANISAPKICVIPFAAQLADFQINRQRKTLRRYGEPLRLLTVSTWERRKNLPSLLKALLQAKSLTPTRIELAIVGRRGSDTTYDDEVLALCNTLSNVALFGAVDDSELAALYGKSHFLIYSSCEEGFGLPIVESLWLATPVVCHNASAMAEIAIGGGVLTTDMNDVQTLASLIVALGENSNIFEDLCVDILARPLQTWKTYAGRVLDSLDSFATLSKAQFRREDG